ncbi:phosphohydrolase, putative [Plasmodium ovale wallikeri]|uniref:Phosphohydrolase, putative n=1 Tax=Plasmodium ovale wallikeri TaxID=864142 RepID=A0A1A9A2A9_PLAOA|nr:phosphohydrolase, putative [Plasmodium ovale wallikeri]
MMFYMNEFPSLEKLLRKISLDREDIILQTFKVKNIKTIYDLVHNVSFFKFTTLADKCSDESGDINDKLVKENGDFSCSYGEELYHIPNATNGGNDYNSNGLLKNSVNSDMQNGVRKCVQNGARRYSYSCTQIDQQENHVTSVPTHSTISEVREMYDYYEKVKHESRNMQYNSEHVYFDIHINADVINILPSTEKDKEKLIKIIYEIIEKNDILMMCVYLNLGHLWPKFELCNIRNIDFLKKLIMEGRNYEWIKNEMGISFYEFILIINFVIKVKKKRIFCKNIFNKHNDHHFIKKKKDTKTICDKIHQFIEFDNWTFRNIIDNPFFQRLRNLSQLGACQFVYPGATHTRFEHSLGVGFLSGKYFTHLCNRSNLSPYHGELNRMLRCVQIAGLCHDLGHGPFSHTFESFFMNYKKEEADPKWNHASMSLEIVEHIIENLIDQDDVLDVSDVKVIKKLIKGREHHNSVCGIDPIDSVIEASFDIICNNTNGLDADKFDYLQRDATIAPPNGTLPSLNCNRIIGQSAVINGHITYNVKEIHPVWTVYMNRFSLFKQVYTHRKVRAMELMLCDGFRLADDLFKWSESLHDLDSFLDLTDSSIIYDIKKRAKQSEQDEKIKHSLNLINSVIHDRNSDNAYKYISEINISEPKLIKYLKDITNEERIARYTHGLSPDDIIIDWNYLNYGMGANDPLDSVYFYTSDNEDEAFIAHKEYRGTHPRYFEECNVRLYCKNKKVAHLAKEAHLKFLSNDVFSDASPFYQKKIVK